MYSGIQLQVAFKTNLISQTTFVEVIYGLRIWKKTKETFY